MYAITASAKALLSSEITRLATCWEITRLDGEVIRLTDHNGLLVIPDEDMVSQTFYAAGGLNATAKEREAGYTAPNNLDLNGITSDLITHEDLRGGRYDSAKVEEFQVDWRYPWAGKFNSSVYYLKDTHFNRDTWRADARGLSIHLSVRVGDLMNPTCRYDLGEAFGDPTRSGCKVDLASLAQSLTVTNIVIQRSRIYTDRTSAEDNYFAHGHVEWLTGSNAGLTTPIKRSTASNGMIQFELKTPYDIEVGDTGTVKPGCDHTWQTCNDKFGNLKNYGGTQYAPGAHRAFEGPRA